MHAHEEAAFERKAEKMLRGQRELPSGRDFRCFTERERSDLTDEFRESYDATFPDAPGSPRWLDKKFGKKKGRSGIKQGFHSGGGLFGK